MKEIDFGSEGTCCPCGMPEKMDNPRKWYPTLHLTSKEEPKLPKSGVITFRYKKVSSEERDGPEGETYSCTLEIKSLVDVEADEGAEKEEPEEIEDNAGRAIDKLAKGKGKGKGKEEEEY